MNQLYNSDFFNHLHHCKPVRMIFADPPDAIGLKYNGFKDEFSDGDYRRFMSHMIRQALGKCEVFWLSFNSRHTLMVGSLLYNLQYDWPHIEVKPCVQTFTFGQHNHHDLGDNYRPLYRIMHKGTKLYPDQVRVPSWRQLNGDKRADPRGRVPGNVAELYAKSRDCLPLPVLSTEDIERFLSKIDRKGVNDCWEWKAGKRGGYGRFRVGDHLYGATRLMWRLTYGTDPRGQLLLHTCDNPACCNPKHLFLGSDGANNRDKENKGRGKHPKGEDNGLAKLSEEDVMLIYQSIEKSADLAAQYGVSDVCIHKIRSGETWTHVTGELALSDVFNFPRVTGNSKQRKVFSPTQLHEGLYERCIKLSCSPGDTVIDLFAGSGTLGRVAEKCGVNAVMLEISGTVCDWIARDQDMLRLGLNAWGKPTGVPTNERC